MHPFKVIMLCLCVSLASGYIALRLASPTIQQPLGAITLPAEDGDSSRRDANLLVAFAIIRNYT